MFEWLIKKKNILSDKRRFSPCSPAKISIISDTVVRKIAVLRGIDREKLECWSVIVVVSVVILFV